MAPVVLKESFANADLTRKGDRVLPVHSALIDLLPEHGLRRGSVIGVSGTSGASSLVLGLLARPLAEGSWGAVVGIPELGIEAASGIGVRLDRLALVPRPGSSWVEIAAVLIDAVDLVILRPPSRCSPSHARRLAARGRERGCVLIVVKPGSVTASQGIQPSWPEPVEIALEIEPVGWQGLGHGTGTLVSREVVICTSGRRVVTGPHRALLHLPGTNDPALWIGEFPPVAASPREVAVG